MKKAVLAAAVFFLSCAAQASGNFSVWAGYDYLSNPGINNMVKGIYEGDFDSPQELSEIKYGITAGLDGAYWYYSWWGIGARISYTVLPRGMANGIKGTDPVTWTIDGSAFRFMAGMPVLFEFLDGRLSVGGGAYVGIGYASMRSEKSGDTAGYNGILDDYGFGIVFEAPVRLTYHISSSFLMDLNLSWKSSDFKFLTAHLFSGADFSGIMAGLGFNWRFSSHDWPWYEKKWSWTE